jgi:hypothetical protein
MSGTCSVRTRVGDVGITMAFLLAAGIALMAPLGMARADIRDGLVVHLTFEGDVSDHSGHGNDGAIVRPGADSPYVPGIIGMAYQTTGSLNGIEDPTGSYITLGSPADLNFGTDVDFSFSWWGQYLPDGQHDDIAWISNKDWNAGANRGYVLSSEPGGKFKWNYRSRSDARRDSPTIGGGAFPQLDDGQWHHFVVTFTRGIGGNGAIYFDGVLANTSILNSIGDINFVFPTNIFQDGTGVYTDVGGGANWNNALMDDLGIWRRVLTDDEVSLIFTLGQQGVSALDPAP